MPRLSGCSGLLQRCLLARQMLRVAVKQLHPMLVLRLHLHESRVFCLHLLMYCLYLLAQHLYLCFNLLTQLQGRPNGAYHCSTAGSRPGSGCAVGPLSEAEEARRVSLGTSK